MGKSKELILFYVDDYESLMSNYIKPFEDMGYNIRAKFLFCEVNVSIYMNIARELATGRIINIL